MTPAPGPEPEPAEVGEEPSEAEVEAEAEPTATCAPAPGVGDSLPIPWSELEFASTGVRSPLSLYSPHVVCSGVGHAHLASSSLA
jgi:hypothetical protein